MTADARRAEGPAARLAAEVLNLLDRERDLLVAGRFEALGRAAETRETQLARLSALGAEALRPVAAQLDALRAAASRNAGLLKAAMEGAASARRRLAALGESATSLTGYDASGAPVVHGAGAATRGRRA